MTTELCNGLVLRHREENDMEDSFMELLVSRKPSFMCVITGHLSAVVRDPDSGVFIVPLTSLRP